MIKFITQCGYSDFGAREFSQSTQEQTMGNSDKTLEERTAEAKQKESRAAKCPHHAKPPWYYCLVVSGSISKGLEDFKNSVAILFSLPRTYHGDG